MKATDSLPEEAADQRQVLTRAVVKTADYMGLKKSMLARVVGISAATAGRMVKGKYLLNPNSKEWDLAKLLIRLYRSLDAIMAGDENALQSWLHSDNHALKEKPVDLIRDVAGLVHTMDYVDSYRAKV